MALEWRCALLEIGKSGRERGFRDYKTFSTRPMRQSFGTSTAYRANRRPGSPDVHIHPLKGSSGRLTIAKDFLIGICIADALRPGPGYGLSTQNGRLRNPFFSCRHVNQAPKYATTSCQIVMVQRMDAAGP